MPRDRRVYTVTHWGNGEVREMNWRQQLLPLEMCDVCGHKESWLVVRELVGMLGRYLVCEECFNALVERAWRIGCRVEEILDGMAEHGHLGSV